MFELLKGDKPYVQLKSAQFSAQKTSVDAEQPSNADSPILETDLGIVMDVKSPHPQNANLPMLVTELGMVTLDKPPNPLKA